LRRVLLFTLFSISFLVYSWVNNVLGQEVPELRGRKKIEAIKLIENSGLLPAIKYELTADPKNVGKVLDQSPKFGAVLPKGEKVEIVVGEKGVLVPALEGKSENEALKILRTQKLNSKKEIKPVEYRLIDSIVQQSPQAGEVVSPQSVVKLTVGVDAQIFVDSVNQLNSMLSTKNKEIIKLKKQKPFTYEELKSLFYILSLFLIALIVSTIALIIIISKKRTIPITERSIAEQIIHQSSPTNQDYEIQSQTSLWRLMINEMHSISVGFKEIVNILKEKSSLPFSTVVEERVAVEEKYDHIELYNLALTREELQDKFKRKFNPIRVEIEYSPELDRGKLAAKDFKTRYYEQATGGFYLVPDGVTLWLYPTFNLPLSDIYYAMSFDTKGEKEGGAALKRKIIKVDPSRCKKIDSNRWEVIDKGEITID